MHQQYYSGRNRVNAKTQNLFIFFGTWLGNYPTAPLKIIKSLLHVFSHSRFWSVKYNETMAQLLKDQMPKASHRRHIKLPIRGYHNDITINRVRLKRDRLAAWFSYSYLYP